MVALFMLATLLFFLGIDYLTNRARKKAEAAAPQAVPPARHADKFMVPRGYFFNPGHTWAELLPSGNVRVGIDDFLQKIVGSFDAIHVLKQHSHVDRGEPVMVVKQGERLLSVSAPLAGNVIAVNEQVLDHPEIIKNDPYTAGWILMIEPKDLEQDIRTLTIGAATAKWLKGEVSRFRDFIRSCTAGPEYARAGLTMADGGFPLEGALQHASEKDWHEFENRFLSARVDNIDHSVNQ